MGAGMGLRPRCRVRLFESPSPWSEASKEASLGSEAAEPRASVDLRIDRPDRARPARRFSNSAFLAQLHFDGTRPARFATGGA